MLCHCLTKKEIRLGTDQSCKGGKKRARRLWLLRLLVPRASSVCLTPDWTTGSATQPVAFKPTSNSWNRLEDDEKENVFARSLLFSLW